MDVVLVAHDLGAGKDNGVELLPRLRRTGLVADALPVLYTRRSTRPLRERAKAAGYDGVVAPDDLPTHILFALARRVVEQTPDDDGD